MVASVDLGTNRYYVLVTCTDDTCEQPGEIHSFDAETFESGDVLLLPTGATDMVGDGHGHLYVGLAHSGIAVIDLRTFRVTDVRKTPLDVTRLAFGSPTLFARGFVGEGEEIASFATDTLRLTGRYKLPKDISTSTLSFDAASQNMIVADESGFLTELDRKASLIRRRQFDHGVLHHELAVFASDNAGRIFGSGNDSVVCFELTSLKRCWRAASSGVNALGLIPGRDTLIVIEGGEPGRVVVFDTATGARRANLELLWPSEMAIDPLRNRILVVRNAAKPLP